MRQSTAPPRRKSRPHHPRLRAPHSSPFPRAQATPSPFPAPLSHVMYIRRRRRGSSWATTRPTRVMIPTRYRSRTSRTHQRRQRCNLICMRPAPLLLPTHTCAMQMVACGHGECCSSSLVAAVELEKKSYVDGFVARLVAGAVYTISKSEQAAST